jgi:hypothetical protein
MPLTKVSFSVIQVANNVTSTTVGNTTSIPSFTFDQNGVITSASNVTPSIANTQITGVITAAQYAANSISNTNIQTGAIENYLNSQSMNLGMRNRIINGNMAINQRGVTSGITSGYFVDRWTLSGCSTSATLTSSLPTGFNSGISISATSGNPIAIQKVEAKNCSDLSGRNVTLSFYAKNISNATTLYASLGYATASDNFGSTTTISEQNLGTLTSDWVRYTYTWTSLPSGVLNGLALNLLCAGTGTFSMGITGVQLEVGNAPTPFEYRHFTTELALCQRYCINYRSADGGAYMRYGSGYANSTTNLEINVHFPVQMRTTPSLTVTATPSNYVVYIAGGSNVCNSGPAIDGNSKNPLVATVNASSASTFSSSGGGSIISNNNSTSYMLFTAEL